MTTISEERETHLIKDAIPKIGSLLEAEAFADALAADGELTALIRAHIKLRMDAIAERKA